MSENAGFGLNKKTYLRHTIDREDRSALLVSRKGPVGPYKNTTPTKPGRLQLRLASSGMKITGISKLVLHLIFNQQDKNR